MAVECGYGRKYILELWYSKQTSRPASLGACQKCRISSPIPELQHQNLHFITKSPRRLLCTPRFERTSRTAWTGVISGSSRGATAKPTALASAGDSPSSLLCPQHRPRLLTLNFHQVLIPALVLFPYPNPPSSWFALLTSISASKTPGVQWVLFGKRCEGMTANISSAGTGQTSEGMLSIPQILG